MPFLDPKGRRKHAQIRDFTALLAPGPTAKQQGMDDMHPPSTRAGTWSSERLTCSFNKHLFSADHMAGSGGCLRNNTFPGGDHTGVSVRQELS